MVHLRTKYRGTHPVFISTFSIPPLPHTHTHTHTPFTLTPSHTHPHTLLTLIPTPSSHSPPHSHPYTGVLPSSKLWYDCLVGSDDMERTDGCHWQRESHCRRAQVGRVGGEGEGVRRGDERRREEGMEGGNEEGRREQRRREGGRD